MKAMIGLVVAILIIFCVTLFWPTTSNDKTADTETTKQQQAEQVTQTEVVTSVESEQQTEAESQKIERMQEAYALLEKARTKLKRQLSLLKHEMWGRKFEPAQAKEINELMLNAHKFNKLPPMLGAFSSAEEIQDELDKVNFAIKSLEEVQKMLESSEDIENE